MGSEQALLSLSLDGSRQWGELTSAGLREAVGSRSASATIDMGDHFVRPLLFLIRKWRCQIRELMGVGEGWNSIYLTPRLMTLRVTGPSTAYL